MCDYARHNTHNFGLIWFCLIGYLQLVFWVMRKESGVMSQMSEILTIHMHTKFCLADIGQMSKRSCIGCLELSNQPSKCRPIPVDFWVGHSWTVSSFKQSNIFKSLFLLLLCLCKLSFRLNWRNNSHISTWWLVKTNCHLFREGLKNVLNFGIWLNWGWGKLNSKCDFLHLTTW